MTTTRSALRLFPFFLAASTGAAGIAQEAPKHLLRNAYEVGKTTWYRQTQVMDQKMKVGEKAMDTSSTSEFVFRCDTPAVADGKATVRRTFTRIKVKMTGMMKVDYDSADPESRPGLFGAVAEMVDQWIELKVDDRGRIADAKTSPDFPEQALTMFGGDLKQWMAQSIPSLPDTPIAVGETWQDLSTMPMAGVGEMKLKITTTLVAVEGRQAKLHQVLEMATDGLDLPGGVKMSVEKAEGDTSLDLATGMPVTSAMTTTMRISGVGAAAMDMTMVIKQMIERIDAPGPTAPPTKSGKGGDIKGKDKDAGGKDAGGK